MFKNNHNLFMILKGVQTFVADIMWKYPHTLKTAYSCTCIHVWYLVIIQQTCNSSMMRSVSEWCMAASNMCKFKDIIIPPPNEVWKGVHVQGVYRKSAFSPLVGPFQKVCGLHYFHSFFSNLDDIWYTLCFWGCSRNIFCEW